MVATVQVEEPPTTCSPRIVGIKIEVDVIGLIGICNQLDDSGKCGIELRNGGIEIGQVPGGRVNDIWNLIDAANIGPQILRVGNPQTFALMGIGRLFDVIEQNVALVDGFAAAILEWDPGIGDIHTSPNAGANLGLPGLSPECGSDRNQRHKKSGQGETAQRVHRTSRVDATFGKTGNTGSTERGGGVRVKNSLEWKRFGVKGECGVRNAGSAGPA